MGRCVDAGGGFSSSGCSTSRAGLRFVHRGPPHALSSLRRCWLTVYDPSTLNNVQLQSRAHVWVEVGYFGSRSAVLVFLAFAEGKRW